MRIEQNVALKQLNTFGVDARAHQLVRIQSVADLQAVIADPHLRDQAKFILGGGSNIVLRADVSPLVLKVEIKGIRVVEERSDAIIIEAGAGEVWHDFVRWTIAHGYKGLENLALIPGTVGATPVQNVGAYGVETKDRFESLDAVDLATGEIKTFDGAACQFAYRDSVFKQSLKDRVMITHVRYRLPKPWSPVISYADIAKRIMSTTPDAQTIFDWVCEIRSSKLPDPAVTGNAGSFFKNPTVSATELTRIQQFAPAVVNYAQPDGCYKLAAGWLIDQCGWRGKAVGGAAVHDKHALVLINRHNATGSDIEQLAASIQADVLARFGVALEQEPIMV
jgi:UDP-N-acetylmuramate dehydrogenase